MSCGCSIARAELHQLCGLHPLYFLHLLQETDQGITAGPSKNTKSKRKIDNSCCISSREFNTIFRNLRPLRSHLLAFQAPFSEHWSGGRRNCCICSTARPCGADSFLLLMACQTYYNFTMTMPTNFCDLSCSQLVALLR